MEDFKDIEIGEKRYRIGRMTARNGSWVVAQLITKMLPMGMDSSVGIAGAVPAGRNEMTESEFHNIQDHCLRVCARYEMVGTQEVAQNILRQDGRFAFADLETDLPTVLGLTINALMFNCSPFFSGGALNKALGLESLSGSTLFSASK